MPPEARLDCLMIDYPDRGFAVAVCEVAMVHEDGHAEDGPALELCDLDPLLCACAPAAARCACVLVVRRESGGLLGFRTRAAVRLGGAREAALFRLPRVLREAGCPAWVRGVVAADGESGASASMRIWISLAHLADGAERGA